MLNLPEHLIRTEMLYPSEYDGMIHSSSIMQRLQTAIVSTSDFNRQADKGEAALNFLFLQMIFTVIILNFCSSVHIIPTPPIIISFTDQ